MKKEKSVIILTLLFATMLLFGCIQKDTHTTTYYDNGQKKCETIGDTTTRWFESGRIMEMINDTRTIQWFENGRISGVITDTKTIHYYENTRIKSETNYIGTLQYGYQGREKYMRVD